MLATVDPALLDRVAFPLGEQGKRATRDEAAAAGLAVAGRAESQEACFLAGDDYRAFLERHGLGRRPGAIVDEDGVEVGRHDGVWRYTPGQRRGIGIASPEPTYALRADPATNTLVVGPRSSLDVRRVEVEGRLYLPLSRAEAKLRYRSDPVRPRSSRLRPASRSNWRSRRPRSRRVRSLFSTTTTPSSVQASSSPRRGRIRAMPALASTAGDAAYWGLADLPRRDRARVRVHALPARSDVRAPLLLHPRHRARPAAGDRQVRGHGRPGQLRAGQARHRHGQRRLDGGQRRHGRARHLDGDLEAGREGVRPRSGPEPRLLALPPVEGLRRARRPRRGKPRGSARQTSTRTSATPAGPRWRPNGRRRSRDPRRSPGPTRGRGPTPVPKPEPAPGRSTTSLRPPRSLAAMPPRRRRGYGPHVRTWAAPDGGDPTLVLLATEPRSCATPNGRAADRMTARSRRPSCDRSTDAPRSLRRPRRRSRRDRRRLAPQRRRGRTARSLTAATIA